MSSSVFLHIQHFTITPHLAVNSPSALYNPDRATHNHILCLYVENLIPLTRHSTGNRKRYLSFNVGLLNKKIQGVFFGIYVIRLSTSHSRLCWRHAFTHFSLQQS